MGEQQHGVASKLLLAAADRPPSSLHERGVQLQGLENPQGLQTLSPKP